MGFTIRYQVTAFLFWTEKKAMGRKRCKPKKFKPQREKRRCKLRKRIEKAMMATLTIVMIKRRQNYSFLIKTTMTMLLKTTGKWQW